MLSEEEVEVILKEIDIVLGYGGAWAGHTYLESLRDRLKEKLGERV